MDVRGHGAVAIVLLFLTTGCGHSQPTQQPAKPQPVQAVSNRQPNHIGWVFILEYHRITSKEARWDRSRDRFAKDLSRLYQMGFRPVTASEYLEDNMPLPPGASPVVITFDDADPTQFRLKPDGSVDPNCAVGIWGTFAQTHRDFPVKATFYVLPVMWGQKKLIQKKVDMLRQWGSELGSHTLSHPKLSRLSDAKVKAELAGAMDLLTKLGQKTPVSMALPYGISPKNKSLLEQFDWKGKHYTMVGAMLVGAAPAPAPKSTKLNRHRVPRIQGIEGVNGITDWLGKVDRGTVHPYVQ